LARNDGRAALVLFRFFAVRPSALGAFRFVSSSLRRVSTSKIFRFCFSFAKLFRRNFFVETFSSKLFVKAFVDESS